MSERFNDMGIYEGNDGVKHVYMDDYDLEAVQARWIPCWKALPDNEEHVLCTTVTKKGLRQVVKGYYLWEAQCWVCGMNNNVVAWMPLPPPYMGEE
ncbi:MAG: hypothetical protein J5744_07760 [Oscillospiraceae bacterium]|nr:hypothetical protein [Oscillospiraceae bacterium]